LKIARGTSVIIDAICVIIILFSLYHPSAWLQAVIRVNWRCF